MVERKSSRQIEQHGSSEHQIEISNEYFTEIIFIFSQVLFDKASYDKCVKDLPLYKLITPAIVCERFKVRGSLARSIIRELVSRGLIRAVVKHSRQEIYTRAAKDDVVADQDASKDASAPKKETARAVKGKKGAAAAAAAEANE